MTYTRFLRYCRSNVILSSCVCVRFYPYHTFPPPESRRILALAGNTLAGISTRLFLRVCIPYKLRALTHCHNFCMAAEPRQVFRFCSTPPLSQRNQSNIVANEKCYLLETVLRQPDMHTLGSHAIRRATARKRAKNRNRFA